MSEYPRGRSHFAHRLTRLMTTVCAANDISVDGCWLVAIIAHQEDAKRYSGAVTFWNEQLMAQCGFGSRKRLVAARDKAVSDGWLHYEMGAKARVGKYWTLVPTRHESIPDAPIDEVECRSDSELQTELQTEHYSDAKRNGKGTSFFPNPNPSPKGEREAAPASPSLTFDDLATRWNAIDGVARCLKATDSRRRAYRARMTEDDWADSVTAALAKVAASGFCRGENDRGWRADIDFLLKPDTLTKILEGKYDNTKHERNNTNGKSRPTGAGHGYDATRPIAKTLAQR